MDALLSGPRVGTFGVDQSRACWSSPISSLRSPPRQRKLSVAGVCQDRLAPVSESVAPGWFPQLSASSLRAVGQDEQPLAPVRSADFLRRNESRRNAVAQAVKLADDLTCSQPQMAGDVLKEDMLGLTLSNDAGDVRPQVARVCSAKPLAGDGEGLARVARSEPIHDSTPRAAVEGSQIAPHRERSHEALRHRVRQDRHGEGFPLNAADDASAWKNELDGSVKAAASGAEGQDVEGTINHTVSITWVNQRAN